MKLSLDDIRSICFGAVSVEESCSATTFHRFTPEQREAYKQLAPDRAGATYATTGITLDFYTDSESITFSVFNALNEPGRYFVDVYEDDLMIDSFHPTADKTPRTLPLKSGESRVRIYLDNHTRCYLGEITLDDGARFSPAKKGARVLIFGDSITQGARGDHTSLTYASTLIEHFGWNATSNAIGGDIFREWMPGTYPICTPDIITVAYGTNDWNCGREDIFDSCRGFFDRICSLYPDARIIYVSPIWRRSFGEIRRMGSFTDTVATFESIAREHGADVIHGLDIVPHIEEFFDDGLHPNDLGYTVYARALIRELEQLGITK